VREWLLRKMGSLYEGDRLVKVKSWWPSMYWHGGKLEVCGPCVLIDKRGHGRMTCSVIWWPRSEAW
jgi:hypothetical protein